MDPLHNPQGNPCIKVPESSTECSPGKCVGSGELYKNMARFVKNYTRIWDLGTHLCCATVACDDSAICSNYNRDSTLILQKKNMSVLKNFLDANYLSNLAYLCNLFEKLNVLNLSLQGSKMHILNLTEKVYLITHTNKCTYIYYLRSLKFTLTFIRRTHPILLNRQPTNAPNGCAVAI